MHQPEGTTLWGQAQRKILYGMFLHASESQKRAKKCEEGAQSKKTPVGEKCPLKTVALAVKTWRKNLAKVKQAKVARVELRAGGGLHRPEKSGWSAGDKEKYPRNVKTSSDEKQQQQPTPQKPPGGSPKQSAIAGSFVKSHKKEP